MAAILSEIRKTRSVRLKCPEPTPRMTMKAVSLAFGALCMGVGVSSSPAAERTEDRWNLADIYPGVAAWNDDAAKLELQFKEFAACRGHLGESARRFNSCLDLYADFSKRYARLDTYASELFAEDTGLPASLELNQKSQILGSRLEEATSFLKPEVLRLGKQKIGSFLAREKTRAIYRRPLDEIRRAAAHTLDTQGEEP